jgi:(1->4)-alpha-D-glucan 1-alpha-D-glucosylmutase
LSLSSTSTHDTKLGEDARCRVNVLSERVAEWQKHLQSWRRLNGSYRTGPPSVVAPDRDDEYRFYQVLVAIWPPDVVDPLDAVGAIRDRLSAHMLKAVRESARHTSWIHPNDPYEQALSRFVTGALANPRFLSSCAAFARSVARVGLVNSLAQTLLKIASPGVPDFYQGSELWDLHLVDPDNRVVPDYAAAARAMKTLQDALAGGDGGRPAVASTLLQTWESGAAKLFVTAEALRLRRERVALFLEGSYQPLFTQGHADGGVVAFARAHGDDVAVVVAPRLVAGMMHGNAWPIGDAWGDLTVGLPDAVRGRTLRNVLTGEISAVGASAPATLATSDALATFPVALLIAE